jgi:hypothetical protein
MSLNGNNSRTERRIYRINHKLVQGYCDLCSESNEEFEGNRTECLVQYDNMFCSENCNMDKEEGQCVYFDEYPMCYYRKGKLFLRNFDFLHLFLLKFNHIYIIYVLMIIYFISFTVLFFCLFLPNFIFTILKIDFKKSICKNISSFFYLKLINIFILTFVQLIPLIGGILDLRFFLPY